MERVERGPNGELQWVRRVPARLPQSRFKVVQGRHRRTSDRFPTDDEIRRRPPSFSEIERLLEIYVATGEGQGSFLAAKVSEETKGRYYAYKNELELGYRYGSPASYRPPGHRPPSHRPSADSSDSSSDGKPRPGRRPRPPTGPFGGPEVLVRPASGPAYTEGRLPSVLRPTRRYDEDGAYTMGPGPRYAPRPRDDRVWIPLRMTHDDDRRFLRVGEYDPTRRAGYEPDFANAAYIDDLGPQPINMPRPVHTRPERPVGGTEEGIVDEIIISPAAPRGRRYQAHVEDLSDDENERGPLYADLPRQEDVRASTQTRSSSRRQSSGIRITKRTAMRGGGGLDYDPEEARSARDGPNSLRLRGGGPGAQPPTGTSAIVPVPDEIDTKPRKIE